MFTIQNQSYPVRTGDIVVYNTGIFHNEWCTGSELSMLFFAVDSVSIPGLKNGCIVPNDACPVAESGSYDDVLGSILAVMVSELEQKRTHYKAICTHIAAIFCHYILRLYEIKGQRPASVDICENAKHYIQKNYAKDMNLDKIARESHISKYYFLRTFKEYTGISPMKYLLFVRMSAAKDLLSKTDKPIGVVAREVGYDSAQTFSRVFKNSENISPSEYRNLIRPSYSHST